MEKDLVKNLISEYQQKIVDVDLYKRPYSFDSRLNYVFAGLRRVGKSYFMYQIMHEMMEQGHSNKEFLYFNFEDDRIATITLADLDLIKVCYEEMYDTRPIFFLDEIQVVDKWEKFVRRIADQGYRVYVTGSNAKMLSSEIAAVLGGRFIIQQIFPFSFSEYLHINGFDVSDKNLLFSKKTQIIKIFSNYFYYGGIPEVLHVTDKRAWLSNLFQKLYFGDLISRYQIRNDFALKVMIRKLAESTKQPMSFNRIANVVSASGKKISTDTVIDYLDYLKEMWLIFGIENINARLAEKESNKKYYFTDNGILNLFLTDPKTSLLENLVAITLKQLYGDDVYYYQNVVEVDFYVLNEKLAIQACYSLSDESTRKREINALMKLANQLETSQMLIITYDESETIHIDNHKIELIPIWKWLLKN